MDINCTSKKKSWENFKKYYFFYEKINLSLDISKVDFYKNFFKNNINTKLNNIYSIIDSIEDGTFLNKDENQMIGHYWLRNPMIAPTQKIGSDINNNLDSIKQFSSEIIQSKKYKYLIIVGIGGSMLGSQFLYKALNLGYNNPTNFKCFFIDNPDSESIFNILNKLSTVLSETLCIIISKSGNTIETKVSMIEIEKFFLSKKLEFKNHAIAITLNNSALYNYAIKNNWLKIFPLWKWIGGRTSIFASPGLLPAYLQGFNMDMFLKGGKLMDNLTRKKSLFENPAILLASSWFFLTKGNNKRNMIILPYKDRLSLFANYIQQLAMESIGKKIDLDSNIVQQGLTVYGHKGSTDQHSYMQQILEGPDDAFIMFIEVLNQNSNKNMDSIINMNDYLHSFLLGTRQALYNKNRQSITISINTISELSLGAMIALFERAVGIYAILVNVNAYNQPAVELSKTLTKHIISIKKFLIQYLYQNQQYSYTITQLYNIIIKEFNNINIDLELLFKLMIQISCNNEKNIKMNRKSDIYNSTFQCILK